MYTPYQYFDQPLQRKLSKSKHTGGVDVCAVDVCCHPHNGPNAGSETVEGLSGAEQGICHCATAEREENTEWDAVKWKSLLLYSSLEMIWSCKETTYFQYILHVNISTISIYETFQNIIWISSHFGLCFTLYTYKNKHCFMLIQYRMRHLLN